MIFCYKYLHIENYNELQAEIDSYCQRLDLPVHTIFKPLALDDVIWNTPKLFAWFTKNNLKLTTVAYIAVAPESDQVMHVDPGQSALALNFPVGEIRYDAHTSFYRNKGRWTNSATPYTNVGYIEYTDPAPEEVGRYVLTQPTLLHIKIPHSIKNPGAHPRVCLSFRFKIDPWNLI
jgi:hypothetical protein